MATCRYKYKSGLLFRYIYSKILFKKNIKKGKPTTQYDILSLHALCLSIMACPHVCVYVACQGNWTDMHRERYPSMRGSTLSQDHPTSSYGTVTQNTRGHPTSKDLSTLRPGKPTGTVYTYR